ncbi:hypothetical protein SDC9_194757 [bioreactor metagenome]|uniref:Uncharacterized protein n=1 Tax=bioreactor metagenome TaxID=1076179 RepID=A0A645I749_9ZZZZ
MLIEQFQRTAVELIAELALQDTVFHRDDFVTVITVKTAADLTGNRLCRNLYFITVVEGILLRNDRPD